MLKNFSEYQSGLQQMHIRVDLATAKKCGDQIEYGASTEQPTIGGTRTWPHSRDVSSNSNLELALILKTPETAVSLT